MLKLAVLISGRGSNMTCLADAIGSMALAAQISVVISNRDCDGIGLANTRGLPTRTIKRSAYDTRLEHEQAMLAAIDESDADLVFLAGYMAILESEFVEHFKGRLINIHPSLLPAFKGLDTHQRALDAGATTHGVSVHLVTAKLDDGPLIAQASLLVNSKQTAEQLAARVLQLEHQLYPFVLKALTSGHLQLVNGDVHWHQTASLLGALPANMRETLGPCLAFPEA